MMERDKSKKEKRNCSFKEKFQNKEALKASNDGQARFLMTKVKERYLTVFLIFKLETSVSHRSI